MRIYFLVELISNPYYYVVIETIFASLVKSTIKNDGSVAFILFSALKICKDNVAKGI